MIGYKKVVVAIVPSNSANLLILVYSKLNPPVIKYLNYNPRSLPVYSSFFDAS
jgi:hypothetical protein